MKGEGTESALRGLDLATGARSLSGSVKPGTRRRGAACPAALTTVAGKMFKLHTEAICPAHAPVSPEVITLCVAELHGIEMCSAAHGLYGLGEICEELILLETRCHPTV